MAIDSIGRVGATEAPERQQASLQLEDFLNIFLTQLNFQDPLEPLDNREFLAQLAQFSSLELSNQSNENSEGLLEVNALTQTMGLLGRSVEAVVEAGNVQGEVVAMRVVNGGTELTLKQASGDLVFISPAQVTLIADLEP